TTPWVGLARNVGRKQAMEMLLTGGFIDAATARERGLVNHVVPADALDAEIDGLAASIVAKPPGRVRVAKPAFYRKLELGLDEASAMASEVMAENMMACDAAEDIDAFIEKRPPTWRGR